MANTGLNYIIKVQMDQLGELQKLHDTIVAIQQLSQKGAEFNVRVNEQSLNSLTNDIATSVSKGFSRAGLGTSRGTTVSVDTTKLESSIQKLSEVVGAMGRQVPPNATPVAATGGTTGGSATVQKINTRVREIEATIKLLDDVVAQRVEATKEVIDRLKRGARGAGTAGDESAIRESLEARKARLEGIRARVAAGSQGTVGITLDASVLNRAFETGAQRLSDALRKGIEEATTGLATAITEAVSRGLGGTGAPPVPPTSPQQAMAVVRKFAGSPDIDAAIAAKAQRYMQGLDTRSANLTAAAAQSGVMAIPRQYEQIMTRRVTDTGQAAMFKRQIDELKVERAKFQSENNTNAAASAQAKIDDLEIKRSQAVFATINKQIDSAVTQYRAVLATQRERNQLSPEEYTRKLTAINEQANARTTLMSGTDIGREMVLLPQALAQYVRNTLNQYVQQINRFKETGQPIDQSLLDEIQSSAFISNLAGARPRDAKQASGAAYRVNQFLREFGSTKTAFEYIRSRGQLGLPAFNPNLDVATAPFLQGMEDPGSRPRAEREQYLQAFFARGGGFAPQTEERRAYAQKMLERLYAEQATGNMRESRERLLLEYQREMEFGGRYYYTGSGQVAGQGRRGLIDGGALLSPDERVRVRAGGGVRSNLVGTPLGGLEQELSADAKAATNLYQAMTYVEGALNRVNKTIAELAKVSFDPMIAEFKRLGDVMKPYAETLAKTQAALAASRNLSGQVSRVAEAREKTRAVEEERTSGAAARAALRAQGAAEQELANLAGLPNAPRAFRAFSSDPAQLRDVLVRQFGQISSAQYKMYDQNALIGAQIASGMNPMATMRANTRTSAQYDALMGSYAANLRAVTRQDPTFFGGDSGRVRGAAADVLRLGARRSVLGENLQALQQAEALTKSIDERLARLSGSASDPKVAQVIKGLNADRDRAQGVMTQRLDYLRSRGLLGAEDEKSVRGVADAYGRLNRELARSYDALLKVANGAVQAEKQGGSFADRLITKFQNLSQYVMAGSVIYTIAAQLRQAANEAIGLEADIRRIQGVLSTRSGVEAGIVGQGIVQAAMDYGTPLRQSVQSGRLFAQTGASVQQTVELTRASLAAQVGAGLDANQATELLIAVENITNRQVKATDIVDRISRVEAQYAVTAQDLSNAIQRAGSLAQQLQPQALGAVDALDLIIGSATTIIERTRITGEQAATSLRFIISRLSAPEVSRQLQERFNINFAGATPDTMRPLQDILQDIATQYNELRSSGRTVEAQQLLTTFAGARQSNVAAALLTGFDEALRAAETSAYAFGDTQERVRLQLDTLEAKFQQFNTAFSAFAASIFNDTGLGFLLKRTIGGATNIFEAGQTGAGALAVALGAGAVYGGSRMAAARLAAPRAVSSAVAGFEATSVGATAGSMAAPGAVAAMGARGLGGLATMSGYLAVIFGVVSALELVVGKFKDLAEIEETRTANKFDEEAFRRTDFARNYSSQAEEYGLESSTLQMRITAAARNARSQVEREVARGITPDNQRYERTVSLVVSELDRTIPGFSMLGDEATRAAEALSLLKLTAKLDLAVPQTYFNEFMKDMSDVVAGFSQNTQGLLERLRANFSINANAAGTDPRRNAWMANTALSLFNNAYSFNGRNVVDFERTNIAAVLRGAVRANQEPLAAADSWARQNLVLTDDMQRRMIAAETELRSRNQTITIESRYQEALKSLTNATDEQRNQLRDASRRFFIQSELADQIIAQLRTYFRTGGRIAAAGQARPEGEAPGQYLVDGIQQSMSLAIRRLEQEVQRGTISRARLSESRELLQYIRDNAARVSQRAQLIDASVSVRDRLFEPVVNYASAMTNVQSQMDMTRRFGLSFDPIRARAEAAQQLLTNIRQVPVNIQRDLIREQARLLGGIDVNVARTVELNESGAPTTGGRGAMFDAAVDQVMGNAEQRRNALARIEALRTQYQVSIQESLGGFIQQSLNSTNGTVRTLAEGLRDGLTELERLGPADEANGRLQSIIRVIGTLDDLINAIVEGPGRDIEPELNRQRSLAAIAREGETARLRLQLSTNADLAVVQSQLARQQANPLEMGGIVASQQRLAEIQRASRLADAERTLADTLATIQQQFPLANDVNRQIQETNARAAYDRQVMAANQDARLNVFNAATGLDTQLSRRQREDSLQLVQNITDPLRSLLMSPNNFSRQGYRQLIEGTAQAAQQRMVDVFMRQMFSETGLLGNTLARAFEAGAFNTETAIEAGFRRGIAAWTAANSITGGARAATTLGNMPGPGPGETMATVGYGQPIGTPGAGTGELVAAGAAAAAGTVGQAGSLGTRMRGAGQALLPVVGSLAGGAINTGIDNSYAAEGASMGAMIGNMIVPGVGGLVGGLLGGLFGSRASKGDDTPEQQISALERIERNTRQQIEAIENQTRMLTLDSRFLNVPAGFTVPGFRPFAGGAGSAMASEVTINVYGAQGQSEEVIATKVAAALQTQLRGFGTSYDLRN